MTAISNPHLRHERRCVLVELAAIRGQLSQVVADAESALVGIDVMAALDNAMASLYRAHEELDAVINRTCDHTRAPGEPWHDTELCPCGAHHYRCLECGHPTDPCQLEPAGGPV